MEEEKLTLSSLERRSWADFTSPSYARIGGKPPPWSEEQISQGGRSLRGGLDQTSRGREKAGADSRGSSQHGESGVSAGPRPLRWSEQRGRREKMGPASRETAGRIGGRRGREKRKAGRNLHSPSPAT